jgi:hypothetical protein
MMAAAAGASPERGGTRPSEGLAWLESLQAACRLEGAPPEGGHLLSFRPRDAACGSPEYENHCHELRSARLAARRGGSAHLLHSLDKVLARRYVALLAVVAYWLSETRFLPGIWRYSAYALALVAVVLIIQQWLEWWVTEIAITNRRIIYKKGLIRRQTNEMNMDKVESVQIDQSILGRMLDYGDVKLLGTGEGFETLRTIASPIELRNSVTGTTHKV